jgi:NADPH2:quinone reductase
MRTPSSTSSASSVALRRAVGVTDFGGPEVLHVVEVPVAEPRGADVVIRVHAAAVNPTDTGLRSGAYGARLDGLDPPYVPGMDAAGVVERAGELTGFRPGDEVMAVVNPIRPQGGAYTELLTVPAASVAPVPDGATLEQAATLPMNGLTAKVALDVLRLEPGETFGVTGAAGVLGGYAVALGRHLGLRVVADARPEDEDLVRSFGAHEVVPRGGDVGAAMRAVAPGGVDGLLDAAVQREQALAAVRDGGRMVSVRRGDVTTERGIEVRTVLVFDHLDDRAGLELLHDLAGDGTLALRVAGSYPPEDAAAAHRRFAEGGVRGRLLLRFA